MPASPQDDADRLDPEPFTVLVDVVNQHRGGHLYLILQSNSAAAEVFRISLTRRNSRTSSSSSTNRCASSVVMPDRKPPSNSA